MSPKKEDSGKKEGGKDDEDVLEVLQAKILEKDLEIETLTDKLDRLETRSQYLSSIIESQKEAAKENEEKLQDVIACLSSDLNERDAKSKELEILLENAKAETDRYVEALKKELNDLKNSHKFTVDDLRLQLDNAQVLLREINDFNKKRAAIEQEIMELKDHLAKEKKDHKEAVSAMQRTALQEKERLRKEIVARVEETKRQMLLEMDGQLSDKTKRTILKNEQLGKELAYHVRQTEFLLQKNEKLVNENIELRRKMLLAKEIEEDMARRNHMYQKTERLLVYKLREKHFACKTDKGEEEDLKKLIHQYEQLKVDVDGEHQKVEKLKDYIVEKTNAVESASAAEQAMKFLYACLEDIELEKLGRLPVDDETQCSTSCSTLDNGSLSLPTSLDQLSLQQRQDFLRNLLRMAISLRAVTQNVAFVGPAEPEDRRPSPISSWCYPFKERGYSNRPAVAVEDILALSVDNLHLDARIAEGVGNQKPVSVGVQTDQKMHHCRLDDSRFFHEGGMNFRS